MVLRGMKYLLLRHLQLLGQGGDKHLLVLDQPWHGPHHVHVAVQGQGVSTAVVDGASLGHVGEEVDER
jgi:hypothetical protein